AAEQVTQRLGIRGQQRPDQRRRAVFQKELPGQHLARGRARRAQRVTAVSARHPNLRYRSLWAGLPAHDLNFPDCLVCAKMCNQGTVLPAFNSPGSAVVQLVYLWVPEMSSFCKNSPRAPGLPPGPSLSLEPRALQFVREWARLRHLSLPAASARCYLVSSSFAAASCLLPNSGLVASAIFSANFRWEVSSCSVKS